MINAVAVLVGILLGALLVGLPAWGAWRERRQAAATALQIAVTDAIGGELGAIVAPVVQRRVAHPWQVRIAVPFVQPGTVGRVLAIAHRVLRSDPRAAGVRHEIVLTAQETADRRTRLRGEDRRPLLGFEA